MKFSEFLKEDFETTDAPAAHGKFRDLTPEALAKWLMKTRKNDKKRVYGSLQQQIRFNHDSPVYIRKMEKTSDIIKSMKD